MPSEQSDVTLPLADYEKDREAWNLPLPRAAIRATRRLDELERDVDDIDDDEPSGHEPTV